MDDNKKELIKIAKEYISNIEDKINNAKIEDSDLTAIQNMTKKLRDVDVTTKPGIKARKKDVTPEEYADEIYNHIMNYENLYNRYLENGYQYVAKRIKEGAKDINEVPMGGFGLLIRDVAESLEQEYGKIDHKTYAQIQKDLWEAYKESHEWYAKKKEGNGDIKVESKKKMTDDASEFISKKIKYLMDKEDMPQKQAIAVAYQMAEKEGYKVSKKKVKASEDTQIPDEKAIVLLEDKKTDDLFYVWYDGSSKTYKGTPVNNYRAQIQNERLIKTFTGHNSMEEVIDYAEKYMGLTYVRTKVKASEGKQVDKVYVIFNDTDVHKYEVGESFVYASEKIVGIVISNGDKVELELQDNGGSTSFVFEVGKNLEGGTYGDDIVTAISETDPRGGKGIESSDTTLTDKLWDIVMNGMQDETDYYDVETGDDKAVDIIYPKNHKEFTKEEQQGVFAYVIWVDEQGFKNTKIILEEEELESFLKWLGVGEGEEDEEDNDIESNIKELYNVMIEESKVKASDKYTIDDIEYVESNHINPNTKKREWYYTTKDKKYITSMADKQGYSYWMSKPSLAKMGDLSYDYLFVLDSESAKQDAVTLLNKLLNRYSTASVNFKQSEQYKEFRTIVLSMLTKALTDKVIEASEYDNIMNEYKIEASEEEIKEILAKSPTIITVTYDISKLSEGELMDIVPDSEFTYGTEGDEIVIRDGTHIVKFVIEADENGILRLKRKQEIQAGAKQYYILDDTNDKWNISKELKYRLIINDDRGSVYQFKSGADYVLFEGFIYNGTKLDVKEFVDDEVEDGSKIINISELPPADRGIVEEKLKELKIMSSEIKAEDRPPKPENPPQGKKYVWDGTNKDWILVDANA